MKAAKKRYHKKIPKFWNLLKNESKKRIECDVGMFYCPYIPIFLLTRQINDDMQDNNN